MYSIIKVGQIVLWDNGTFSIEDFVLEGGCGIGSWVDYILTNISQINPPLVFRKICNGQN